jgi:hypothetical protein
MVTKDCCLILSKAIEVFLIELGLKSFQFRKTINVEDIKASIKKTDYFDFILDTVDTDMKSALNKCFESMIKEGLEVGRKVCWGC